MSVLQSRNRVTCSPEPVRYTKTMGALLEMGQIAQYGLLNADAQEITNQPSSHVLLAVLSRSCARIVEDNGDALPRTDPDSDRAVADSAPPYLCGQSDYATDDDNRTMGPFRAPQATGTASLVWTAPGPLATTWVSVEYEFDFAPVLTRSQS